MCAAKRDLPKYVYRKPCGLYFWRRPERAIKMQSPFGSVQFEEEYKRLLSGRPRFREMDMIAPSGQCHFRTIEVAAKKRAHRVGREYTLPDGWAKEQFDLQRGLCAVSGLRMFKDRPKHAPWAPSIDRKNSRKGYTRGNCQLVAYIVNCARNQFTDEEFFKMCKAVADSSKSTH